MSGHGTSNGTNRSKYLGSVQTEVVQRPPESPSQTAQTGIAHGMYFEHSGTLFTVDRVVAACHGEWSGDVPEDDTNNNKGGVTGGYARVMKERLVPRDAVKVVGTHVRVVCESI